MARPKKAGLDYFPLDASMDETDDDIKILQTKHGNDGFVILIKLYMKIYSSNGYYYKWGEKESILHANRCNCEINKVNEVVKDLVEWGVFDKELYKKYGILTSKRIQQTYMEATSKRTNVDMIESFLSVNEVKSHINLVKGGNNPQSKVKESKVKKSKVKDIETVFNYFVSKNIVNHKKLTDEFKKDIGKALEENSLEQIKIAIDHYSTMYHDSSYEYCNYKWGIHEFFTRKEGYRRFLDDGSKWLNYLDKKGGKDGTYTNGRPYDKSKFLATSTAETNDENSSTL